MNTAGYGHKIVFTSPQYKCESGENPHYEIMSLSATQKNKEVFPLTGSKTNDHHLLGF